MAAYKTVIPTFAGIQEAKQPLILSVSKDSPEPVEGFPSTTIPHPNTLRPLQLPHVANNALHLLRGQPRHRRHIPIGPVVRPYPVTDRVPKGEVGMVPRLVNRMRQRRPNRCPTAFSP